MTPILEPILAGLFVSLINKYVVNSSALWLWCNPPTADIYQHEDEDGRSPSYSQSDDLASSNTTVSDISLDNPHIYVH